MLWRLCGSRRRCCVDLQQLDGAWRGVLVSAELRADLRGDRHPVTCAAVVGLLIDVGAAVPVSFLRYDIAAAITGVFDTAGWVGPAIVVLLGHGIVGVAVFYLVSAVVALLAYLYFGRRLMRTVRRDSGPERDLTRRVLSFAGLVALQPGRRGRLRACRRTASYSASSAARPPPPCSVPGMRRPRVGGHHANRIAQVLFQ